MRDIEDLIKKLTGNAFDMNHSKLSKTEYGMYLPQIHAYI